MEKLIDSSSFFPEGEPTVNIINFDNKDGLVKQAADSRVTEYIGKIQPEENKIYVHILAMGAGEYYGANRNADYFPEHNLIDYHKTFETSPAHIFRNHINKDPAIAIGQVVFSIYNPRMHRVEIIAWIDKEKAPDVVRRIESGDFPATSMACKTPYDVCSICGNKAHTRQEYCEHLRDQLGKVYPDGRKVMSLNVAPLKFFDMSIVVRPADVTSSVLQKVASESPYGQVIGSAEAAEVDGLLEQGISKEATIQKLSEFIKEVDGQVVDSSDILEPLLEKVKDPDTKIIDTLVNFKVNEVLSTMAHLGISPSITFLAEFLGRKMMGDSVKGIGSIVESAVNHAGAHNIELPKDEHIGTEPVFVLKHVFSPYMDSSSYLPEYVEKRAFVAEGNNIGYVGNGPHLEQSHYEKFREQHLNNGEDKSNFLKMLHTILAIGGAALAAKWFITRTIEQKMKEAANSNNNGVKIILVKSASDYAVTYKLAKAAMVKVIRGK